MTEKLFGVSGGPIDGVVIKKLNKIADERGTIMHMLRQDDSEFNKFGEVYFSTVYPGAIKAWHIHKEMELNYAVVSGEIKMVLFDDRAGSKTRGNLMEIFTGERNYLLIKVPAKIWNGFKGIGTKEAIVCNCATLPHDTEEISRLDPLSDKIPYNWDLKNG
jgi:dTDP-4-dehydrorhamnose 3,5-epimerase